MPGVLYQAGAPGPPVRSSLPLLLPLQRRAPWIIAVWYHFTSSAAQRQLSPLQLYWLQGSAAQLTQGHHVPEKCIHGGLPESLSLEMGQVRHPGGRQQRKQAGVCSQACVTLKCSWCEPLRLLAAGCSAGLCRLLRSVCLCNGALGFCCCSCRFLWFPDLLRLLEPYTNLFCHRNTNHGQILVFSAYLLIS